MPKKADKAEAAPAEVKKEEVIDFSKVEIEPLFADQVDFDTFSKSDFRAVKIKACEAVKKSKKLSYVETTLPSISPGPGNC